MCTLYIYSYYHYTMGLQYYYRDMGLLCSYSRGQRMEPRMYYSTYYYSYYGGDHVHIS